MTDSYDNTDISDVFPDDLKLLIEKVYELAGLLEVAGRDQDARLSLGSSICRKAGSIVDSCRSLFPEQEAKIPDFTEDFVYVCDDEDSIGEAAYSIPDEEPDPGPEQPAGPASVCRAVVKPLCRRSVFSINDRFLFARELFGGSLSRFDACIAHADALSSLADVNAYLASFGWNPEEVTTRRFLEILTARF